jgi:hypothetical protein
LTSAVREDQGPQTMLRLVRSNVEKAMRTAADQFKDSEFDFGRDIQVEVVENAGTAGISVKALSPAGRRFKEWLAKQSA